MKSKPRGKPEDEIIKCLVRASAHSGYGASATFDDWLELVEAAIDMAPVHVQAFAETGEMAKDPPPVKTLWERMRQRYHDLIPFADAFCVLLEGSVGDDGQLTYRDVVGQVFMLFGHPNTWTGQFFTPFEIARFMAMMTFGAEPATLVHQRLRDAIGKSPAATAMLLAGLGLEGEAAQKWYFERVIPACLDHYEPVSINDPAVGSGVLLLAAASIFPRWMITRGLVTFYGTDIDRTCVRMCRINCRLYGLRGAPVRLLKEAA